MAERLHRNETVLTVRPHMHELLAEARRRLNECGWRDALPRLGLGGWYPRTYQ